jgi:myo-inositol-1(or 4)-monophosphatase
VTPAEVDARFVVAGDLIREAGALALRYFNNIAALKIVSKGPQDMASQADLETEILIRDRLKQHFPHDAFFGEETGASDLDGAAGIWVVDPIDGTQPFVSSLPTWCVSIAFVAGGVTEIGMVFAPVSDELFVARRGAGASLNGRPIQPHTGKTLQDGIVSVGYSPRVGPAQILPVLQRLLAAGGMFHRNGSGTLSLCYVGCGRLLGYVEPHINSWDCLAALLVITEAGGQTNDFLAGEALLNGNRVVAGPPAVFAALQAVLG